MNEQVPLRTRTTFPVKSVVSGYAEQASVMVVRSVLEMAMGYDPVTLIAVLV